MNMSATTSPHVTQPPLPRRRFRFAVLRAALPIGVLAGVWAPHYWHYQYDHSPVQAVHVEQAINQPSDQVLDEIGHMPLSVSLGIPAEKIVESAHKIMDGTLTAPTFLDTPMTLRGYPDDFRFGPPTLQLIIASLAIEDLLLEAFEKTHDPRLLQLANERIQAFSRFEKEQHESTDFLWNDHAVAARVSVLARLWRHIRHNPDIDAGQRTEVLSFIVRNGRLLAKPEHFTARTNHGVMQNLGLLQTAAAFPDLPESQAWSQLALDRLALQFPFYVSSEGMVLEHSAEYHFLGTELLAQAVRLSVLTGHPPPAEFTKDLIGTRTVLSKLLRPDGSLPLFGNTQSGHSYSLPSGNTDGSAPTQYLHAPFALPEPGSTLLPLSGYAIWWNGTDPATRSQTTIAWAKQDGHGHKHADETAVMFWSGGTDWITGTGYWPYGTSLTKASYGWDSSNAVHQPGESPVVTRSAHLLSHAEQDGYLFVDVQRTNADGAEFRRQILQIDPQTLLVLDFADKVKGTETNWTVAPPLLLSQTNTPGRYITNAKPDGRRLAISRSSSRPETAQILRGSTSPFAGWVVVDHQPTPSDTLRVVGNESTISSATLFRIALR